jgi:hypothetical protein
MALNKAFKYGGTLSSPMLPIFRSFIQAIEHTIYGYTVLVVADPCLES